jgi:hypothetical protein
MRRTVREDNFQISREQPDTNPSPQQRKIIMTPTIPIFNPRSAALVGLTMADSEESFRIAWLKKYPVKGPWVDAPTSSGSPPKIGGDAQKRAAAEANFLGEVHKIFDRGGIEYSEAWRLAASTDPGKTYLQTMLLGIDKETLASSGPLPPPATTTERYDPRVLAEKQQAFVDLTERLARDGNFPDRGTLWHHASTIHPEGKQLFAEWKAQEILKQKDLLAKDLQGHPPSLYRVENA